MMHRDFLMRQLHQAIQVLMQALTRVNRLKSEEKYDAALSEVSDAFAGLDMAPRPVGELSAEEIAEMCRTAQGFEADLALSIADLLAEEGEVLALQGSDEAARASFQKALYLYREALQAENAALPLDIGRRMSRLEELIGAG